MTEPNRDVSLDELSMAEPVTEPASNGHSEYSPFIADEEAPYGRKPDGTPFKRRSKNRPGYDTLPNREAGASKPYTKGPRRSGGSLETQIGAFLFTLNAPIMFVSARDALDTIEIEALAHAIDQECQRSARFRKFVEQALAVQGGTSLVLVLAAIAGRRVVRHNIVEVPAPIGNEGADALLGGVISMSTGKGPINPNLRVMPDAAATSS